MDIYRTIEIIENEPAIYEMLKFCPYEILKQWSLKEYKKGEFLLNQGESYDTFYIIIDGIVDIYVMSENGKKYSLTFYKKGNYIGEHEIFDRLPYSCFVEGVSDVKLLEIKREYFLKWLELDKNISSFITKTLCRQFYKLSNKAGKDTLYTLKQRICQFLIDTSKSSGNKEKFRLNVEKVKLSEEMAVTQRSVNRVLKDLKEKGIIEIDNNIITIEDLSLLKNEAESNRY
jgi:CRP-like cAMP-binding protein